MKKMLVIDDDPAILDLLKFFFSLHDFDTKVAASCEEGLDIFYSFLPDIVLLDINVGPADGRLMCQSIKSNTEYGHIPVILISANASNLQTYKEYGADDAIEKPFDITELLARVQAVIAATNTG